MGPRLFRRGNRDRRGGGEVGLQASMGPRLFRRGNMGDTGRMTAEDMGFNGATSFQTWKWRRRPKSTVCQYGLQWGHVFSDVEMAKSPMR